MQEGMGEPSVILNLLIRLQIVLFPVISAQPAVLFIITVRAEPL